MEIYVSIDGVLRNTIQKFKHQYDVGFSPSQLEEDDTFEYGVIEPIQNNNLLESFKFQSKEQYEYFLYIEFVLEIFAYAGLSHENAISSLNKIIALNPQHTFTIVGLNEFGKAKPSTLFFLSKNGYMGNNIKFIKTENIKDAWEKCDYWLTDCKDIIDLCPEGKTVAKFNTPYNEHFTNNKEISKLQEIKETWLTSLENTTTLTLSESSNNVE